MTKYIYALDLALNSSGICIFSDDGELVYKSTIDTNGEENTPLKLKKIGNEFNKLLKKYSPSIVVIEEGFVRYNASTKQIFRVHGVVNYLFYKYPQIYIPSSTVKKTIGGKGNIKKEKLREVINMEHPSIEFDSLDESDAYALGQTYFCKKRIGEL